MKRFVVAGVAMAAILLSLSGCYWPGPWHHHHHDRDGDRYERNDSRRGYDHERYDDRYYRR